MWTADTGRSDHDGDSQTPRQLQESQCPSVTTRARGLLTETGWGTAKKTATQGRQDRAPRPPIPSSVSPLPTQDWNYVFSSGPGKGINAAQGWGWRQTGEQVPMDGQLDSARSQTPRRNTGPRSQSC